MTIPSLVDARSLLRESVALNIDDLKYGFDHGWLSTRDVIELAEVGVERGDTDPNLVAIAMLLREDEPELPDLLAQLNSPDRIFDPRESARKWLYLLLKGLYEKRGNLDDPLALIEELYADFEYPPAIESLVRYMPPQPGEEPGIPGLLARWREFIQREEAALAAKKG